MIVVVDCRDSYTYNLVAMLRSFGETVRVVDEDSMCGSDDCEAMVLSPGPGSPGPERGSWKAAETFRGRVPILGVCLGHQTISAVRGGRVVRGDGPVHGKIAVVHHGGRGLFEGIPDGFGAVRYNSLCVDPGNVGEGLRIDAVDDRGDIMALSDESDCMYGVQFHPESFMTEHGGDIVRNFLEAARSWRN